MTRADAFGTVRVNLEPGACPGVDYDDDRWYQLVLEADGVNLERNLQIVD